MVNKIKVVVVEDEILAQKRLTNLFNDVNDFEVLEVCSEGLEAQKTIMNLKPDVVFTDIQLNDITGFDVVEHIKSENYQPIIIITSAFEEYAVKAFDVLAFDYLLKPYKDNRFYETLEKIREIKHKEEISHNVEEKIDDILDIVKEGN